MRVMFRYFNSALHLSYICFFNLSLLDFVEKNNFRCNGHFEVIDIGIADTQKCLQRCDKINSCLFFSMLSKSNVCYLFNATAVCASTPDPWITAQKGL